ncbi:hypothetical protein [Catellatospora sichuanensis]|uniref:hypothetical protein n=1 Tax=Catellatospora sichuanensis TaxID=1969805 RepID=UPI0011839128|nr:hypothetical protein [Catellatospora sichuanensis]
MYSVTLEAPGLAKALANALYFIPAASKIQVALIEFAATYVMTAGTDSYVAGTDQVKTANSSGLEPEDFKTVLVTKKDLDALEKAARAAKKGVVTLTVDGEVLTLETGEGEPVTASLAVNERALALYDSIAQIVIETEFKRPAAIPGVSCIDPAKFSPFAKVKTDKTERMADIYQTEGDKGPWLIKIGPTFKGLLMPINRDIHRSNVGPEGLW